MGTASSSSSSSSGLHTFFPFRSKLSDTFFFLPTLLFSAAAAQQCPNFKR
jgi:hypothetical protein